MNFLKKVASLFCVFTYAWLNVISLKRKSQPLYRHVASFSLCSHMQQQKFFFVKRNTNTLYTKMVYLLCVFVYFHKELTPEKKESKISQKYDFSPMFICIYFSYLTSTRRKKLCTSHEHAFLQNVFNYIALNLNFF